MHLYAGGCSLTWGKEILPQPSQEIRKSPELTQERLSLAWPGLVQQHVGFGSHYNDGRTSGSNMLIARRLFNYVENYPTPEDLYVVIAWSGISRWEVRFEDKPKAFFMNKGHRPMTWAQRDPDVTRYWKAMGHEGMRNKAVLWDRFLMTVLGVQSFLKNRSIPYQMVYGISPNQDHIFDTPLLGMVDRSRFQTVDTPKTGFNDLIGKFHGTTEGHIAVGGHPKSYDVIAPLIAERVRNDLRNL